MQLLIDGVDRTSLLQRKGIAIADALNARSTCSLRLLDRTGAYRPDVGDPMEVYDGANLIFAGTVDEPEEVRPMGTSALDMSVAVVDWHQVADRRIVAEAYDDEYAGNIVRDIIKKYLAKEGIRHNLVRTNANATADFSDSTGWSMYGGANIVNGVLTLQSTDGVAVSMGYCTLTNLTQNASHSFLVRARYKDGTGIANVLTLDLYATGYDNPTQELIVFTTELTTSFSNFTKVGFSSDLVPTTIRLRLFTHSTRPIEVDYVQLEQAATATDIESIVQDGPMVKRAVFNYITASECLNELSELTGLQWVINPNKSLGFFDRATNAAPWGVTTNSDIRNVVVRRNRDNYRNRQYLRAGRDISTIQTRNFKGDGATKVWAVDLPVAQVPIAKVDGVTKTVGIRGLEKGKDWYWQKDDKSISQDDGAVALTSANTLTVEYQGLYPIIVAVDDIEAIGERKAAEGGTGLYEHVEQRTDIDEQTAAMEHVQGLLRRYARIGPVVTYQTYTAGLKPGQLQNIVLPEHNVSGDFLISRVSISDPGAADGRLSYAVEALSGEAVGGWAMFFKKLVKNNQTFVIRENEILIKLLTFRDSYAVPRLEDEMTYTLHQYKICGQVNCGTGVIL